jgi:hypothetical protein
MQPCQNAVWTQSVFQSLSFEALLVGRSNEVYSRDLRMCLSMISLRMLSFQKVTVR